jgi:hypothetical protein
MIITSVLWDLLPTPNADSMDKRGGQNFALLQLVMPPFPSLSSRRSLPNPANREKEEAGDRNRSGL